MINVNENKQINTLLVSHLKTNVYTFLVGL